MFIKNGKNMTHTRTRLRGNQIKLANHQHPDAALIVYQRHLRDYPLGPYSAEAHLGAGLVQLYARDQPTAAYQHLVMVLDAEPHPDTEAHARSALAEIASRQKLQVKSVH